MRGILHHGTKVLSSYQRNAPYREPNVGSLFGKNEPVLCGCRSKEWWNIGLAVPGGTVKSLLRFWVQERLFFYSGIPSGGAGCPFTL